MPAKAEGMREDSAVIFPKGTENKLMSQNKSGVYQDMVRYLNEGL